MAGPRMMHLGAKGMNKQKVSILTLLVAFVFCMAAMCISFGVTHAEDTVEPVEIFTTSGGASLDSEGDYLNFSMGNGSTESGASVAFRRNLALKWYAFDGEPAVGGDYSAHYLELTFAFANTDFDSFTVTLESTQMTMSKAGKTTNEIVFTPNGGNVTAVVNGEGEGVSVSASEPITITLSERAGEEGYGNFVVSVNGSEAGTFTNIGRYYAQYASASADTPITPLTFSAETDGEVSFEVQSLNGQSFELTGGEVTDNAAPVLVIDSEIKQILLGTETDFDTIAIDVCSSTVTTDRYYLADGVPATSEDGEPVDPAFEDGDLVGYNDFESDKRFFETDFNGNVGGTVSIAFSLTDGNANTAYYFIEWYAAETDENGHIMVVHPESVVDTPTLSFDEAGAAAYQEEVTAAALDEDGNSIQVGDGAYYYLPSLRAYVSDATCGYTDMTFHIYYRTYTGDTESTSGAYDELRIEMAAEGLYEFRIVPVNSAGKAMVGEFENGENTISASNVWDATNLTTFRFRVTYTGPSIDEPEEGEVGYVDVAYEFEDFDIIALGDYQTRYTLYRLELNEGADPSSVSEVLAGEQESVLENTYGTWVKISVYDNDLESDEGDNAYDWNPDSSLSFVPQEIGYYKVVVEVASANMPIATASQVVNVRSEADVIPGDTYWLQENLTSVIFLGIGVLCLIGIVIVLLIKPKDKNDKKKEDRA